MTNGGFGSQVLVRSTRYGALEFDATWLLGAVGALDACRQARSVVLKPNWVSHANPPSHDLSCLVTQVDVIHAVAASVAEVLPRGAKILLGDAPVQGCDFAQLRRGSKLDDTIQALRAKYSDVEFDVADWRLVRAASRFSFRATERVDGWDPRRHVLLDLGPKSFLEPISDRAARFRVTCYPPSGMQARHSRGSHQYLIARDALDADVVINLPKLKTHIKAGITCALKNLVGINGHKEFLPHHVTGTPSSGGDSHEHPSALRDQFERFYDFHFEHLAQLPRPFISVLSRALNAADRATAHLDGSNFGSWPGNDTVWRMTLDLNHLLYAWAPQRPKHVFTLVDAITVGEGDGPLRPEPAHLGLLLAGRNPAAIDWVAATLMGFDPMALPTIREAMTSPRSVFAGTPPTIPTTKRIRARRPTNWELVAGPPDR